MKILTTVIRHVWNIFLPMSKKIFENTIKCTIKIIILSCFQHTGLNKGVKEGFWLFLLLMSPKWQWDIERYEWSNSTTVIHYCTKPPVEWQPPLVWTFWGLVARVYWTRVYSWAWKQHGVGSLWLHPTSSAKKLYSVPRPREAVQCTGITF